MNTNKHDSDKHSDTKKRVIRLDDLDWEDEVTGGSSGKLVFGEQPGGGNPFDRPGNSGGKSTTRGGF